MYRINWFSFSGGLATSYASSLLIAAVVVGIVFALWLLRKKNAAIEKAAACLVLAFGILYIAAITPLSAPDDGHHYKSTYVMVSDILGEEDLAMGEEQDFDFTGYVVHHNELSAYEKVIENTLAKRKVNDEKIKIVGPYQYNYPCEYMFPAVGVLIARLLGFNAFWIYTMGEAYKSAWLYSVRISCC